MDRACIEKVTGKLIEMQSGGKVERRAQSKEETKEQYQEYIDACDALEAMRLDTLRKNALNAGYKEEEIEVKWVTNEEWQVIEATLNQPTPEQIAAKEKEVLIQAKIRKMAEAALIAEGKLTEK